MTKIYSRNRPKVDDIQKHAARAGQIVITVTDFDIPTTNIH